MPLDRPRAAPGVRILRTVRVVVFSLLPLLALLVGLELLLWALGMGDPAEQLSLSRGFDDRASYFVPDPDRPGGWQTQMFNDPAVEVRIPPRDGRIRVLLLGGSNTWLFPDADLAAKLDAAAPGRRHEVLNLGRPGYGSERVRILLGQALVALEPDVVVLYCGHNEFVEAGFAAELAQEWKQPWLRRAVPLVQRSRTINALAELMRGDPRPDPAGPQPETRQDRSSTFALEREQTQIYYDQYRANLRAICREAARRGTGLVLCTVVGNMLSAPVVLQHGREVGPETQREFNSLLVQAHGLVPERLVAGMIRLGPDRPLVRVRSDDWGEPILHGAPLPPPPPTSPVVPELRPLPPPLDGVLWTDPAGWQPVVFDVLATASAFHARDLSPEERQGVEGALAAARRAVELSPEHALGVFELGLYLDLAGDTEQALHRLREAPTLDCAPNRGSDVTNAIVREVAAEHPEAVLVDADRLFTQRTPDGLVGYELMMDNCHLHPGARLVLMSDLVPAIRGLLER